MELACGLDAEVKRVQVKQGLGIKFCGWIKVCARDIFNAFGGSVC